jgi:hypothetical protein
VAVVAAISPREADAVLPSKASASASVMIDSFRDGVRANLSRVKAEFAEEKRERLSRGPPD